MGLCSSSTSIIEDRDPSMHLNILAIRDLISRRPDVRRADAEIAAAEARLGVARSELYPRLTLAGLVGRQSNDITHFGLGVANFFSLGPALRLPLFTGGRIRS